MQTPSRSRKLPKGKKIKRKNKTVSELSITKWSNLKTNRQTDEGTNKQTHENPKVY